MSECVAWPINNRASPDSHPPPKVPPRWTVEPQDTSVVLGNAVSITCRADGFPTPTVVWKQAIGAQSNEYRELGQSQMSHGATAHHQQLPANGTGGVVGVQSLANGSLVIGRVRPEHSGEFLCQASNGIGADLSKLIRLTVNSKCRGGQLNDQKTPNLAGPITFKIRAQKQKIMGPH